MTIGSLAMEPEEPFTVLARQSRSTARTRRLFCASRRQLAFSSRASNRSAMPTAPRPVLTQRLPPTRFKGGHRISSRRFLPTGEQAKRASPFEGEHTNPAKWLQTEMATSSTKLTHSLVLLRPSFKNVLYLASLGAAILPVSTTNLSLSQGTELWLPPSSSPRRRVYSRVFLEAVQCGQQSKRPKPLPRAPTSFACWYVPIGALSGLSPTTLHVYFPCDVPNLSFWLVVTLDQSAINF